QVGEDDIALRVYLDGYIPRARLDDGRFTGVTRYGYRSGGGTAGDIVVQTFGIGPAADVEGVAGMQYGNRVVEGAEGLGNRATVARGRVAVGILDRDGNAEGGAGCGAGRSADRESARPSRIDRDAGLAAGDAAGGGVGRRH